jgi:hypothetical protein
VYILVQAQRRGHIASSLLLESRKVELAEKDGEFFQFRGIRLTPEIGNAPNISRRDAPIEDLPGAADLRSNRFSLPLWQQRTQGNRIKLR